MRTQRLFRKISMLVAALSILALQPITVWAQVPTSSNYSAQEYYFGTGGSNDLNSSLYNARAATGALGVGDVLSTNYSSSAGPITPEDEYIEFVVNAATIDLGLQSVSNTSQGTATFYVKAYVADGYVVRNAATPPTYNSHTMTAPSSATTSAVGTEQFGINLAGPNTCALCLPLTSFGAAPVQVPDSSFSFGSAATGYNTANSYKYVNGDIIAQSTKSSGQTTYTISYILNISTLTPAGEYRMNHIMVATGTY